MQQCPKCGSQAPDDAIQCSICFAPLGQAAPVQTDSAPPSSSSHPAAPPPGLSPFGAGIEVPREEDYMPSVGIPGVDNIPKDAPPVYGVPASAAPPPFGLQDGPARTTLAGDVIEGPPPNPYGTPIGGAPMGPQSMRAGARPAPIPVARNRSSTVRGRSASAESEKSGGVPVIAVILTILVLGGAGAGGFWFWQKKQAPAKAADKFFSAMKAKDWKTMYSMVELPADQKSQMTEDRFVMVMNMVGNMFTIKEYTIGESTIDGDTAKVKVTVTATVTGIPGAAPGDNKNTQDLPLKNFNGVWKLDGTSARAGMMPGLGGMGNLGGRN